MYRVIVKRGLLPIMAVLLAQGAAWAQAAADATLLEMREAWKHFANLPEDVRAFASNPVNIGFIHIALMLSQMPTDRLRQVGASIVDITM